LITMRKQKLTSSKFKQIKYFVNFPEPASSSAAIYISISPNIETHHEDVEMVT